LQSSTDVLGRTSQSLIASSFPDAHAYARLPGSPGDYGFPFHAPRRASQSPWAPSCRTIPFRRLHLLRSFDPPTSPCAPNRVAPLRRSILSWASAPLKRSPSSPRILDPPRPPLRAPPLRPKTPVRRSGFLPVHVRDLATPALPSPEGLARTFTGF